MYAICVESSHRKGMGHLFRALNLISYLVSKKERCVLIVNDDKTAIDIIKKNKVQYEIVNLQDYRSDWEGEFIRKNNIHTWINDRLDTRIEHAINVKNNKTNLITFDDKGSGAEASDINFAGLPFNNFSVLRGRKVFSGLDYLILNQDIKKYRRIRYNTDKTKTIISLGGSDTYGVTIKVIEVLKKLNKSATVVIGPSFRHRELLKKVIDKRYLVKDHIKSLIKEFTKYDLAITGGGITPFEANASGLPCMIIANERFEIPNAKFLENTGSSIFTGYYNQMNTEIFEKELNIEKMSRVGIRELKLNGLENVYMEIKRIL